METKEAWPDTFLFFQVGDFYELFFDDAEKVAQLLDLTLTSRQKIGELPVPMCGVPLSSGDLYINRLASMGYKVTVCDQESNVPLPGEKVARRKVKRIVTPGTIISSDDDASSRYLAFVHVEEAPFANPTEPSFYLAAADISTGDFFLTKSSDFDGIASELMALDPKEILFNPAHLPQGLLEFAARNGFFTAPIPEDTLIDPLGSLAALFSASLPQLEDSPGGIIAAGVVTSYLKTLSGDSNLAHLMPPRLLWESPYLYLDESAIRNLELTKSLRDGSKKGTLFELLDRAATPMGSRLLKDWLVRPSRIKDIVLARHGAVAELITRSLDRDRLFSLLKELKDFARSCARLSLLRGTLKDLLNVQKALSLIPSIAELLKSFSQTGLLCALGRDLTPDFSTSKLLNMSLNTSLGQTISDGAALLSGLAPKLDKYRSLEEGGKKAIAALEAKEREKIGVPIKVGYNRVFGYYLEVTKSHLKAVPGTWTRKQTLASAERYVTSELLDLEEEILTASEKRAALEERILANIKKRLANRAPVLMELAKLLAQVDALASLALSAEKEGWVRPQLIADDIIDITLGRHPVVEANLPKGETFVANDTRLGPKERILIITGPNMAGKSTILRQVALIVVLCQMGSFIPAQKATLSIRDAVFTRVGAADDLARGRSTFMVEMSETARILNRATSRSLVILDEVGRGTSTFDGLAIAWAVAEYLHDHAGRGVPTLFATHYHELVELAKSKPLAINYNVSVKKWEGKVIFLRKLVPGGTSRSYGLAVAALAGLPKAVTRRAGEILKELLEHAKKTIRPQIRPRGLFETQDWDMPEDLTLLDDLDGPLTPEGNDPRGNPPGLPIDPKAISKGSSLEESIEAQGTLLNPHLVPSEALELLAELKNLDTEKLTPIEALNLIHALKIRAQKACDD
jgi:DNA mismatch repair protein MutS